LGEKNTRREEVELDQSRQMVERRLAAFRIRDILSSQVQSQTV